MGSKEEDMGCIDRTWATDLANHGSLGKPYTILKDKDVGRHVIATRDIHAGQVRSTSSNLIPGDP